MPGLRVCGGLCTRAERAERTESVACAVGALNAPPYPHENYVKNGDSWSLPKNLKHKLLFNFQKAETGAARTRALESCSVCASIAGCSRRYCRPRRVVWCCGRTTVEPWSASSAQSTRPLSTCTRPRRAGRPARSRKITLEPSGSSTWMTRSNWASRRPSGRPRPK